MRFRGRRARDQAWDMFEKSVSECLCAIDPREWLCGFESGECFVCHNLEESLAKQSVLGIESMSSCLRTEI